MSGTPCRVHGDSTTETKRGIGVEGDPNQRTCTSTFNRRHPDGPVRNAECPYVVQVRREHGHSAEAAVRRVDDILTTTTLVDPNQKSKLAWTLTTAPSSGRQLASGSIERKDSSKAPVPYIDATLAYNNRRDVLEENRGVLPDCQVRRPQPPLSLYRGRTEEHGSQYDHRGGRVREAAAAVASEGEGGPDKGDNVFPL